MRNRYGFLSSTVRGHSYAKCPLCGRPTVKMFAPHCSSGCVEIAVDEHIERKHEQRERDEDRRDRDGWC